MHLGKKGDSHDGNGNAVTHGMFSDTDKYYQRQDEAAQAYIDVVYETFLSDAPFGEDNTGKSAILWEIAINHHKRRTADGYIAEEGLLQDVDVEKDNGERFTMEDADEHPLHLVYDRLARTDIRRLKELGVTDDPDSKTAESVSDLASAIAQVTHGDD